MKGSGVQIASSLPALLLFFQSNLTAWAAPSMRQETTFFQSNPINSFGYSFKNSTLFGLLENKAFEQNLSDFFFPHVERSPPVGLRTYHMQIDKPDRRSLFALKHPQLYEKSTAMKIDFGTIYQTTPSVNPLYGLQIEEEKLRNRVPLVFGSGSNVIGILPGRNWKHPKDRPIEETGCIGSLEFVRSFLIPDYIDNLNLIQGAIIIDSVINWNTEPYSQDVPAEWYNFTSQKILNDIKENESKGDFIGVISRKANDAEKQMSGMFKSYFDRIKRATAAGRPPNTDDTFKCHRFEISKMPVNHLPSSEVMSQVSHMWRSDHARFWYHNSNPFQSFNSIAISDTANLRGIMRTCYHKPCDSVSNPKINVDQGIQFLTLTSQALVLLVANMSRGLEQCNVEPLLSNPEEQKEEDEELGQTPNIEEEDKEEEMVSLNQSSDIIKWILANLRESPKKVVTTTAKNEQNLHTTDDDNGRIGTVQFHGPYQPNYGTQFNIEQLNVIVDPLKILEQLDLLSLKSLTSGTQKMTKPPLTSITTATTAGTSTTSTVTVTSTTTATTTITINAISLVEKHRLRNPIPFFYYQSGYQFYNPYSHTYRKS